MAAGSARARTRTAVALFVLPGRGADVAVVREVRGQILRAFARDPEARLFDALKAASPPDMARGPDYAPALERGVEALGSRRYRQAQQELHRALEAIRSSLVQVPKQALAEASVHAAAAQLGLGRHDQALRALEDLLVWRPQHDLRLRVEEPPGWEELVAQARAWIASAPTGSVQIASVPPGAEAFVDGRRLGATPVLVPNITVGTHYVSLKLEGYRRVILPVEVRGAGRTVSVPLQPDEGYAAVAANLEPFETRLGQTPLPGLRQIREAFGVSRALFVVVAASASTLELSAYLYDLEREVLAAKTVLDTAAPPRANILGPLSLWRPQATAAREPSGVILRRSSPPWYQRWWVWALVGGVAAAGVAIPLAVTRSSSPETERFQVRW